MNDGRTFRVFNVAWGRDTGEHFDHITTNVSPRISEEAVDLFNTSQILSLSDESGTILYGVA